jgi:hypothetical protein
MTITLRTQSATGASTKGSTLTHAELDDNFIDILQNKIKPIDVRGDTGTQLVGQSLSNEILQVVGGTGISTAVTSDSAGQARITITNSQTAFVPASPGEIGATTPDTGNFTDLKVKSASSTVKELQLHDQDNSNYVGFKAPSTVSTNKVWTLPSTDGTNGQVLSTNGTATLSWITAGGTLNDLTDVTITTPSNGQVLKYSSATSQFVNGTGGIDGLYADPNPSLGGNLTVMGFSIVSASNGNIELAPNGTGDVYLTADTVRVGDSNANVTITTNGTGDLILNTNNGSNSGVITIQDGLDNDITLVPAGTGKVHFETSETRVGINNTNAKITTKGTGDLTLDTNSGSNSGRITIEDGSNGDITLAPNGTGRVEILGTANQQASIRLFEELSSAGNNQSTLLQASKFISADITLTLPNTTSTLGYQNLPAVGTKTGSYTLALADIGKYVQVGSGGSITIPNSTFAEGDVIVVVNNHTAAITITCTITDAYIGGTNTDKATVSLATRGVCNILFLSGTACIITGNVS